MKAPKKKPAPRKKEPPKAPLSLRAYARHRGVTHESVRRAVASGRLKASLTADRPPQIADVALADREWAANTDLSRAPDAVKAQAAGGPATPSAGAAVSQALAQASAAEKVFRAKLAELKYRERAAQLVEAEEIKAAWIDQITTARTKLLSLPSKAKQRMPHTSLEDLATWEELIREALEELTA